MPRTFVPTSVADAAVEIAEVERTYVSNMPEITEFHPIAPVPGGVLICMHDTANDDSHQGLLTQEAMEAIGEGTDSEEEFVERAHAHFTRLARAVFN